MRIQWQSRRFFPDLYGGVEVIGYEVVRQWKQMAVDVSVATENYPKTELMYDEPIEGVSCSRIPTGGVGMFWRIGALARVARWVWHQKDIADEADIVFASNPECIIASKIAHPGRPAVYRCEGITKYFVPILKRKPSRLFSAIEKRAMKLADAITVPSTIVKTQLVNYVDVNEDKIYVVPYGVDFQRFAKAEPIENIGGFRRNGEFMIACLGRLTPEKGIDFLIDAFARLKNRSEAKLLIIGDGFLKDELRRYANNYNLNSNVVFTGKVHNPENYLAAADVHVLMSRYETFGLAHLEAMAAALPTISWRSRFDDSLVGASDIIIDGQTGFCIEPHNIEELSVTLDDLIENRIKAKQIGRSAREYVKRNYSWQKTAERYLQVLEETLG